MFVFVFLEMTVHFNKKMEKIINLIVINRRKVYFVFKILYLQIFLSELCYLFETNKPNKSIWYFCLVFAYLT